MLWPEDDGRPSVSGPLGRDRERMAEFENTVLGTTDSVEEQEPSEFMGLDGTNQAEDRGGDISAIAQSRERVAWYLRRALGRHAPDRAFMHLARAFPSLRVVAVTLDTEPEAVVFVPHRGRHGFYVTLGRGPASIRGYADEDAWYERLATRSERVAQGSKWVWTAKLVRGGHPAGRPPRLMTSLQRLSANLTQRAALNAQELDLMDEGVDRMATLVLASGDFQFTLLWGAMKAILHSLRAKSQEASDRGEEPDYWYPGQEGRHY